jgi:fluoride ion exporter CrcB/FEX
MQSTYLWQKGSNRIVKGAFIHLIGNCGKLTPNSTNRLLRVALHREGRLRYFHVSYSESTILKLIFVYTGVKLGHSVTQAVGRKEQLKRKLVY